MILFSSPQGMALMSGNLLLEAIFVTEFLPVSLKLCILPKSPNHLKLSTLKFKEALLKYTDIKMLLQKQLQLFFRTSGFSQTLALPDCFSLKLEALNCTF